MLVPLTLFILATTLFIVTETHESWLFWSPVPFFIEMVKHRLRARMGQTFFPLRIVENSDSY